MGLFLQVEQDRIFFVIPEMGLSTNNKMLCWCKILVELLFKEIMHSYIHLTNIYWAFSVCLTLC